MTTQLLLRPLLGASRTVARSPTTPPPFTQIRPQLPTSSFLTFSSSSATVTSCTNSYCPCSAAFTTSSSFTRSFHTSHPSHADPAPAAGAKGPKVAGGGVKKVKGALSERTMLVPTAITQYKFDHLSVYKEYKAPDEKVTLKPDSAYPAWIWDQTPEPTWSDLLLADFASLPPTYQKKVFSMPRKLKIKEHNDRTRKA